MKSPYAFIFDMDGVLVDSNPFHKISLKQFCAKYGYELTEQHLREKIYGRTNKDWIPNVFGDGLSYEQIMAYQDEKEALFRELYKNDIHEVAGLTDFLKTLEGMHIPRAIATSAPRANVDFTLSKTGTTSYFPTILDESFVSKGKPDPEIYLKTAKALGFLPENCVVFEDSLSGVKSGKVAGCKVVGITTTHSRQELHETDVVIDDFLNLNPKSLISQLF
jgi:beta-phosphoglucomutase